MPPMARALIVSGATALLFASRVAIGAGQLPPRYRESVDVANVLIDVRALDQTGSAIVGLQPSDFSVTIAGRIARVQASAWIGGGPVPASEVASVPVPGGGAHTTVAIPGRLIVLLFQRSLTNEHARGLIRMVDQSRALVRGLGPSDRVAILSFDTRLVIWTDFTNDEPALDRILRRSLLTEKPPAAHASPPPSLVARLEPRTAGHTYTIERAFELIARALDPLPGAKTIAFFGHGMGRMDRRSTEEGDVSAATGYDAARRALIAARAAVFSLDITEADSHSLEYGLERIADETGGFYSRSLDFPERPMRWLAGALSGYYVLFVEKPEKSVEAGEMSVTLARRTGFVFATRTYSTPQPSIKRPWIRP
jgi:VWFA-related protein